VTFKPWLAFVESKLRLLVNGIEQASGVEAVPYGELFRGNCTASMFVGLKFERGGFVDLSWCLGDFLNVVGRREGCWVSVEGRRQGDILGGGRSNPNKKKKSNRKAKGGKQQNQQGQQQGQQQSQHQQLDNNSENVSPKERRSTTAESKPAKTMARSLDDAAKVNDAIMTPTKKTKRSN